MTQFPVNSIPLHFAQVALKKGAGTALPGAAVTKPVQISAAGVSGPAEEEVVNGFGMSLKAQLKEGHFIRAGLEASNEAAQHLAGMADRAVACRAVAGQPRPDMDRELTRQEAELISMLDFDQEDLAETVGNSLKLINDPAQARKAIKPYLREIKDGRRSVHRLTEAYYPLADSVARFFCNKLRDGNKIQKIRVLLPSRIRNIRATRLPEEDLKAYARLGLLKAAYRYDPKYNAKLSGVAAPRMIEEMQRADFGAKIMHTEYGYTRWINKVDAKMRAAAGKKAGPLDGQETSAIFRMVAWDKLQAARNRNRAQAQTDDARDADDESPLLENMAKWEATLSAGDQDLVAKGAKRLEEAYRTMKQSDASLDAPVNDGEDGATFMAYVKDEETPNAQEMMQMLERHDDVTVSLLLRLLPIALRKLPNSARVADIMIKREPGFDDDGMTLDDLSTKYDVSRERIRQIDKKGWDKLTALVTALRKEGSRANFIRNAKDFLWVYEHGLLPDGAILPGPETALRPLLRHQGTETAAIVSRLLTFVLAKEDDKARMEAIIRARHFQDVPASLESLAEAYGITPQAVGKLEQAGLKKLMDQVEWLREDGTHAEFIEMARILLNPDGDASKPVTLAPPAIEQKPAVPRPKNTGSFRLSLPVPHPTKRPDGPAAGALALPAPAETTAPTAPEADQLPPPAPTELVSDPATSFPTSGSSSPVESEPQPVPKQVETEIIVPEVMPQPGPAPEQAKTGIIVAQDKPQPATVQLDAQELKRKALEARKQAEALQSKKAASALLEQIFLNQDDHAVKRPLQKFCQKMGLHRSLLNELQHDLDRYFKQALRTNATKALDRLYRLQEGLKPFGIRFGTA